MPLNDIVSPPENPGILNENRGDIGTVSDIVSQANSDINIILVGTSVDSDYVYIS